MTGHHNSTTPPVSSRPRERVGKAHRGSRVLAALILGAIVCSPRIAPARAAHLSAAGSASLPLGWVTYASGRGRPGGGLATDGRGDVYVTGDTALPDFPIIPSTTHPILDRFDDAFVARYDEGGRLRWYNYLGGRNLDQGNGIAADGRGNVYVTGYTASTDFPATARAAQPHFGGGYGDAFVASYARDGHLRWATYLGGQRFDQGNGIAVDGRGNVYVTGYTASPDFPATRGAAQSHIGRFDDVFLVSYTADGRLRWATYLGGRGSDHGTAIAVDGQGNLYITGDTTAAALGGYDDAFVASYTTDGRLRWAGNLGGKGSDEGTGIAVDGQGSVYVTGYICPPQNSGSCDAFVVRYGADGRLRWSRNLGGRGGDSGSGIAVDGQGSVYVTGNTVSTDFPVTPDATQSRYRGGSEFGGDAFVAAYDSTGRLRWATYLGGRGGDQGTGIAVDGQGNPYVIGITNSTDFPITPGAAQTYPRPDSAGAFVAHLVRPAGHPAALDPVMPPSPPHARYFPQTLHTLAGSSLALWGRLGGIPTLGLPLSEPFTLAGQKIQVTERAVLVRSCDQITLLPLGSLLTAAHPFARVAPVPSTSSLIYFPGTGHTLSGPFLSYWQAHRGSELLGAPISQPEREGLGDGTGRTYLVQWFVNGRLELHSEVRDPRLQVQPGRVGYEYLHRAGLL